MDTSSLYYDESGDTSSEADSVGSGNSFNSSIDESVALDIFQSTKLKSNRQLSAKIIKRNFNSWRGEGYFSEHASRATIDPTVAKFMKMTSMDMINRYSRLHPLINCDVLQRYMKYVPIYFHWAGADLFPVTTEYGLQKMVVLETNSCPSGQKYMPLQSKDLFMGGYRVLLTEFLQVVNKSTSKCTGGLAVIFDKNLTEVNGYANTLSAVADEEVFLVEWYENDLNPPVRYIDQIMQVRTEDGMWHPIRAAFRYVTQKPWKRIPLHTKTLIFNPIQACLAGGRNKTLAAKAYEQLNTELRSMNAGIQINIPETILDVCKKDVPKYVASFQGYAVIKDPYSNCGQGVYTITNAAELASFMDETHTYDAFMVQSLIGGLSWSSKTKEDGRMFHRGTVPNASGDIFTYDLRMLCYSDSQTGGFRPLGMYSRRARVPLTDTLKDTDSSWEMLGTNLSCKDSAEQTGWSSETERVSYMDVEDFAGLGLGLDDLVSGFIQTVLCTVAIDKMACQLTNPDGTFNFRLFSVLNDDPVLLNEITY